MIDSTTMFERVLRSVSYTGVAVKEAFILFKFKRKKNNFFSLCFVTIFRLLFHSFEIQEEKVLTSSNSIRKIEEKKIKLLSLFIVF